MDNDPSRMISSQQAYAAMYGFLERFNSTYKSNDIAILLSGLAISSDGIPMDKAYQQEWNECVDDALRGNIDVRAKFIN